MVAQNPVKMNSPIPPSCQNSPTETGCSIFAPGGIEPNLHTPTIQNWSLTVERGLTQDLMLSVGYIGMQSYHNPITLNLNMAYPGVCNNPAGCVAGGVNAARATVSQGTVYMPPGPRPNPNIANTLSWNYAGTASYHALNSSLTKRPPTGLRYKVN